MTIVGVVMGSANAGGFCAATRSGSVRRTGSGTCAATGWWKIAHREPGPDFYFDPLPPGVGPPPDDS